MAVFMVLVAAVMVGVVLVILILLFKNVSDASEDEAMRARCKSSVLAYSRMNSIPFGSSKVSDADIICPTRYVTIEDDAQSVMRRDIANLMFDCWNNMGEGKLKLFSAQDQMFCVICSVYQFENPKTQLKGLPSFLMTERAPLKMDGYSPTYYEYFTGDPAKETNISAARGSVDLNYLEGGTRYAIVFLYSTESAWGRIMQQSKLMAAGVAISSPLVAYSLTKVEAGFATNIITTKYAAEGLKELNCDALPVSEMDERFR